MVPNPSKRDVVLQGPSSHLPEPLLPVGRRPRWWRLLLVLLPQFAGLALILPVLPTLKLQFFGGDAAKAAAVQGAMESSRALLYMLVIIELGRLTDAVGRRPLIILSVICTATPLVCLATLDNLYYYFVLFALAGALGGQSTPAAGAYVTDCSAEHLRAQRFGLMGAATSAVFMLMPLTGAYIKAYGLHWVFVAALALEAVALLSALWLPESLAKEDRTAFEARGANAALAAWRSLKALSQQRRGPRWELALVRFLRGMASSGLMGISSFLLTQRVGFVASDFALLMTLGGVSSMLAQVFLLRILVRLGYSDSQLLLFGQVVLVASHGSYLLLAVVPSKALVFGVCLMQSGAAVADAAFTALVTQLHSQETGYELSVFSAIDGVTSFASPLVMAAAFQCAPLAPWLLSTLLGLIAAALIAQLKTGGTPACEDSCTAGSR